MTLLDQSGGTLLDQAGGDLQDQAFSAPPVDPNQRHDVYIKLPNGQWLRILNEELNDLVDVNIDTPLEGEVLTYDVDTDTWINQAVRAESWPTGLIDGGELNIGPGPNDIEVIAGQGLIVDSYTDPDAQPLVTGVVWPQINTPITAAPSVAGSLVHFTIDINGNLQQYATPPDEPTRRDEIYLGVVVHNGDEWGEISSPNVINNAAHTTIEFIKRVIGPTFVIDGGAVTEAALFQIDQEAGTLWEHNRNWHVNKKDPHREALPATTGLQFRYVNRDFTSVGPLIKVVDATQWDDGGVVSPVPGPANTATVQRLYQDPRDNYWILLGQQTYANATEAAASIEDLTEVPPLLQASVLLCYIVTEKTKTDWDPDEAFIVYPQGGGGVGGGGVPITAFTELIDTPGGYIGHIRKVTEVNDLEDALEFEYRTRGLPYVAGQLYYPQEMVFQDGWLMIANTETADYPAPTPVGDPAYTLPDTPGWNIEQNTSQINSGSLYTFSKPGYFRALRVWVPELTDDTNYRIVIIRNPNSANPTYTSINDPILNENAWTILSVDTLLITTGEELLVYIDALNSGSDISPGGTPTDWFMQVSSNTALPTTGNWNTNVQQTLLRINEDDADANPPIDFTGVIPGSLFTFTDTNDPNVSITYLATSGETYDGVNGVYSWTVTIDAIGTNGQPSPGDRTLGEIIVPVAAPTKYVEIPAYWGPGTLPSWAGIQSYLQYDGVSQPIVGDEAYGVDIAFQELVVSPDWDFFGTPSSGGSGGSGGGLEPHVLNYHDDVDTATTPPVLNNVLQFNGTLWVPGTVTGGGDRNVDGGTSGSIYLPSQVIDGGSASG